MKYLILIVAFVAPTLSQAVAMLKEEGEIHSVWACNSWVHYDATSAMERTKDNLKKEPFFLYSFNSHYALSGNSFSPSADEYKLDVYEGVSVGKGEFLGHHNEQTLMVDTNPYRLILVHIDGEIVKHTVCGSR